jgi:hypothetical protein
MQSINAAMLNARFTDLQFNRRLYVLDAYGLAEFRSKRN